MIIYILALLLASVDPSPAPLAPCDCCAKTKAAVAAYCEAEQPMGDLRMTNFTCAARVSEGCQCGCEERLAEMRQQPCPMACKQAEFDCPPCPPPLPLLARPPPPPPPPPSDLLACEPVPVACCEATLAELEKFCFSFAPPDAATFHPDPAHWDGGVWAVPESFDPLCRDYAAPECGERGCPLCPRLLQLLARSHHRICEAVDKCTEERFCSDQCAGAKAVGRELRVERAPMASLLPSTALEALMQGRQREVVAREAIRHAVPRRRPR
jgi:hypothetical protein